MCTRIIAKPSTIASINTYIIFIGSSIHEFAASWTVIYCEEKLELEALW